MDQQGMLQDMNPSSRRPKPPSENHPPPPPQKCPRCDSLNTKFCYYNNYSLSQPRYFCKGCRRYWTHGGTLRNVPVGGGCRKGKRARSSPSPSSVSSPSLHHHQHQQVMAPPLIPNFEQTQRGNLGIPSSSSSSSSASTSSSSSHFFPGGGGGFLSSLAAMNMRSLSPMMMSTHHHQIGTGIGIGFNTNSNNTIPNLPQNQPININDNFCQMLANNEREEPMFVHQQQQQPPQNRGLIPPWAQTQSQNLQIGNPSFWPSINNRNNTGGGGGNSTSSSMMMSPNQWLNLPGCGSGPDSSNSMIDKKP